MPLTSDPYARPPVFLEIPNFGYGPASAALAMVSPVADRYTWHIVSSGEASDFVVRQLPGALQHDLDTNYPARWPGFTGLVPPQSVVISFTNPEFGEWAVQHGYRVGVIDTLDWMWGAQPKAIKGAEFHLVQEYFAMPADHLSGQRDIVRPIVDEALWGGTSNTPVRPATAMIGFGGMHVPDENDIVTEYVQWFLGSVLPILFEQAEVTEVSIVGGRADLAALIPGSWAEHPAVRVHAGLERTAYAALARGSEHILISPGLAHVYECAVAGLVPLVQPGFSMSMVLQAHHVALTGYSQMYTWPWLSEEESKIAGMSEPDGMRYVNQRMMDTVHSDPLGQDLGKAVITYLERGGESALRLPMNPALPDGAQLFAAHLERLTRG